MWRDAAADARATVVGFVGVGGADQRFACTDPFQILQGSGLDGGRLAAGLHPGRTVDDDGVHPELVQAGRERQSCGAGADDQGVGPGRQRGNQWCRCHRALLVMWWWRRTRLARVARIALCGRSICI